MQALVKLKPKVYFSDAWNVLDLVNITCFWCSIFRATRNWATRNVQHATCNTQRATYFTTRLAQRLVLRVCGHGTPSLAPVTCVRCRSATDVRLGCSVAIVLRFRWLLLRNEVRIQSDQ